MVRALGAVKASVVLRGKKKSEEFAALVDTGATLTVIDRPLAKEISVRGHGPDADASQHLGP